MAYLDPLATSKRKPQTIGDGVGFTNNDPTDDFGGVGAGATLETTNNQADAKPPSAQSPQPAEQPTSTATGPYFDPRPPRPTDTPQPAQSAGADPFAASGGGTYFASTGQWVPNNNPAALAAAQAANGGTAGTGGGTAPVAPPPPVAPPAPPVVPPTAPPTTTAPTSPLPPLPPPAAPPTPAPVNPVKGPYQDALLKMLDQASTPATLQDPALKAQSDAAAVGLTRGTEAGRAALAERMAQAGGPGVNSGAFNTELAGLFSGQGEKQAAINSELVGKANQDKIQQLQAALTMMGNDVNSAEGRALTKELAQAQLNEGAREFEANYGAEGAKLAETIRQFDTTTQAGKDALAQQLLIFQKQMAEQGRQFDVDAALKRMGIESQGQIANRGMDIQDKLGTGDLNARILALLTQNDQFGKSLGAQLGMFNAGQGNNYLSALLGQLGA